MKLLRRIRYFLARRRMEHELAEEIEFHRAASGAPAMGNITVAREDARAVWIWPWLQGLWQDAAYAVRGFRRDPGFTLLAVLSLGAAIGLNTSLVTVFNAIVLKPWPGVKDPSRLVRVFTRSAVPTNGIDRLAGISVAEFRYLAEHTKTLSGLVSISQRRVHFGFEPFGKGSLAVLVAHDHFSVLGANLHLGRGFLPEEDRNSQPEAVMVLNYAVWRDRFGSDPAILGKRVSVNDVPFTVVGVAAENLSMNGNRDDVWMPFPAIQLLFPNDPNSRDWLSSPKSCCEPVGARLAAGVTREQAQAELGVLSAQFHAAQRDSAGGSFVLTDPKILAGDPETPQIMRVFGILFLGATLIVLLACANVGNLLVARAAARQREIQIRRALGAGRGRVVRQLLTESLLLAVAAGAVGVAIAFRFPAIVFLSMVAGDPPAFSLRPDLSVLAYVLGLVLLACVCFGLAPALHGTHPRPMRSRLALRNWLLASQVALSMVLLTGAALMLNGVQRAMHRETGFQIAGIHVMSFELPAAALNQDRVKAFASALQRDIPHLGDAEAFALTMRAPLEGNWNTLYRLPQETRDQLRRIEFQEVSPGYFATLGIPLLAGRDFTAADTDRVIVINETAARRWPGNDAIGKTLFVAGRPREIIGVAKNTFSAELDDVPPMMYQRISGFDTPKVIFRSAGAATASSIEALALRTQPGVRVQTLPLAEYVARRLAPSRVGAQIAGLLGMFALALATVGMSGVFAYAVQQRTKEIGIRMALGARPTQVIRVVILGASRALVWGMTVGLIAATAASRVISGFLHGLSALAPSAYISSAAILAAAALAASYVPSRRAVRVDPLTALREE